MKVGFRSVSPGNVVDDESYEVLISVGDDDVLDGAGGRLTRPGGQGFESPQIHQNP
jgi:hypothetical protein